MLKVLNKFSLWFNLKFHFSQTLLFPACSSSWRSWCSASVTSPPDTAIAFRLTSFPTFCRPFRKIDAQAPSPNVCTNFHEQCSFQREAFSFDKFVKLIQASLHKENLKLLAVRLFFLSQLNNLVLVVFAFWRIVEIWNWNVQRWAKEWALGCANSPPAAGGS